MRANAPILHRPPHRQLALRRTHPLLALRPQLPPLRPQGRSSPRRLPGRLRRLPRLQRPRHLRRNPARQPHPPPRQQVAQGRLAGRLRRHPPPAPALDRPGRVREPPVLLLPAGGDRDADLAGRVVGRGEGRHRRALRRRRLPARVRQDGDGLGEDARDGDADRVAGAEPGRSAAGHAVRAQRARGGAGAHGEEPAGRAGAVSSRELLRSLSHRPVGAARQAAARPGRGAQLARAQLGERRAGRQAPQRGQAGRPERRGLRSRRAGRDVGRPRAGGRQRRGPPRLANPRSDPDEGRRQGPDRRGDQVGRRAGQDSPRTSRCPIWSRTATT